jgi:hypothetical protein
MATSQAKRAVITVAGARYCNTHGSSAITAYKLIRRPVIHVFPLYHLKEEYFSECLLFSLSGNARKVIIMYLFVLYSDLADCKGLSPGHGYSHENHFPNAIYVEVKHIYFLPGYCD